MEPTTSSLPAVHAIVIHENVDALPEQTRRIRRMTAFVFVGISFFLISRTATPIYDGNELRQRNVAVIGGVGFLLAGFIMWLSSLRPEERAMLPDPRDVQY